jgi:hypothetical protein
MGRHLGREGRGTERRTARHAPGGLETEDVDTTRPAPTGHQPVSSSRRPLGLGEAAPRSPYGPGRQSVRGALSRRDTTGGSDFAAIALRRREAPARRRDEKNCPLSRPGRAPLRCHSRRRDGPGTCSYSTLLRLPRGRTAAHVLNRTRSSGQSERPTRQVVSDELKHGSFRVERRSRCDQSGV